MPEGLPLLMDRAYEGDETRQLVLSLGMIPVVPPKSNRIEPWEYDRALYKKRNEIERLFRRLKGFRRIFSRFEKLDVLFLGFLNFALIIEALLFAPVESERRNPLSDPKLPLHTRTKRSPIPWSCFASPRQA